MTIDRFVNILLAVFGRVGQERRAHFHSQNLNEDRDGRPKGLPWEGRMWLHWTGRRHREFRFEWNLWSRFCSVSVARDGDSGGLQLHVAFPPVSLWFTLPVWLDFSSGRVVFDLSVHNGALWWQFGGDKFNWSSKTPKWKHGNFNFIDFIFGRTKHSEQTLSVHDVVIPMPEGPYPAKVRLSVGTWSRPRGRTRVVPYANVDIPLGIPHQGKGENSWDCGEDRLFGCSIVGSNVEAAIGNVVARVLEARRKYDGNALALYPSPVPPAAPPAGYLSEAEFDALHPGGVQGRPRFAQVRFAEPEKPTE